MAKYGRDGHTSEGHRAVQMQEEAGPLFLHRLVSEITALRGPPAPACPLAGPAQRARVLAWPTEPGTPEHQ